MSNNNSVDKKLPTPVPCFTCLKVIYHDKEFMKNAKDHLIICKECGMRVDRLQPMLKGDKDITIRWGMFANT